MDFEKELNNRTEEAEKIINRYLPKEEGECRLVIEAADYSVRAGGKRLRPLLMMEVYRLFSDKDGRETESLNRFMAAMEYIHTYSLVHDDLPAMDNDMLRRGKPTTHAVYGEAMAILAGDALLNYAYEVAISTLSLAEENPRQREAVILSLELLAAKAGIHGMIGGQCVDVDSEKKGEALTRAKLDYIYENKTGALLQAAMGIGAILGGASDSEYADVMEIASRIGLAFQIRDDILDETGSEEVLGKPIGSDERNEKATYVAFEGLESSEADVKRLTDEAIELLSFLPGDHGFLEKLFIWLTDRDR
ncbi:MAG: polyprenyl synthetase family protein [Lachnospiraceae bacterium]|nr:polyprenyl synthetase family protein [Lachnospiraceae bacterium]